MIVSSAQKSASYQSYGQKYKKQVGWNLFVYRQALFLSLFLFYELQAFNHKSLETVLCLCISDY